MPLDRQIFDQCYSNHTGIAVQFEFESALDKAQALISLIVCPIDNTEVAGDTVLFAALADRHLFSPANKSGPVCLVG